METNLPEDLQEIIFSIGAPNVSRQISALVIQWKLKIDTAGPVIPPGEQDA